MILGRIRLRQMLNRRRGPRRSCAWTVFLRSPRSCGVALVEDVSRSGMYLLAAEPVAIGDPILIEFGGALAGRPAMSGRVIRIDGKGFAVEITEPESGPLAHWTRLRAA